MKNNVFLLKCSVITLLVCWFFLLAESEYITVCLLAPEHTQTLKSQIQLSPSEAHSQHSKFLPVPQSHPQAQPRMCI